VNARLNTAAKRTDHVLIEAGRPHASNCLTLAPGPDKVPRNVG
jgi:hypothetical protein